MRSRAARLIVAVGVAAATLPIATPAVAPARAGGDLLPDLAVAPLTEFRVETVGGRRLLRFTSTMVNVGAGHFELRGHRDNASQPMIMEQWIYATTARPAAPNSIVPTGAVAMYSGDGHNHWHVQEMVRFDLWDASVTARGAKIGFCFFDTDPYDLSLPGASPTAWYAGSACGSDPNALGNSMGMSIGWGDRYSWFLPNQWVDITGLPSGTYTVRARADPNGNFLETNDLNQCAYATVSVSATASTVTVLQSGFECVNDWSGSGFAADIAWLYSTGITEGCWPELFCPLRLVSRAQMASFLARALNLPAATSDFFTDDETSPHEADINRIAAVGITLGCRPGSFCPELAVSRQEMASFLARAFALPDATTDFFTDDEASPHEADINRIAAAGITTGCAAGSYCPTAYVTREQMAAFLHRAMTD